MATTTHIPLSEYLQTSYRPDREYVDGELRERNAGKFEHARIQALLTIWFGNHEREWGIIVITEQRVQISESRVRIPDLVVTTAGPQPDTLVDPPLLVIEILSPDDSYSDTQERAQRLSVLSSFGELWKRWKTVWVENGALTVFHLSHNAASGGWFDVRSVAWPVVG